MKNSRFAPSRWVIVVALLAGSVVSVRAQSAGSATTKTIAEALTKLAFMKGDWSGSQEFNTQGGAAMSGEATNHIETAVGGRYLSEVRDDVARAQTIGLAPFHFFRPPSGKFVAWWFNDTSIGPSTFEGDVTGSTLVLTSKEMASSGPARTVLRATYESPTDGTLTYRLEMQGKDGAWTRLFTTTYKRKA